VLTAFPNFDDEVKYIDNLIPAGEGQDAAEWRNQLGHTARLALQTLVDKWTLAVTLHGLPPEYDTIKAIIQDWTDIDVEKAKSRIREREVELKGNSSGGSDQLRAQAKNNKRRGRRNTSHSPHGQGNKSSLSHLRPTIWPDSPQASPTGANARCRVAHPILARPSPHCCHTRLAPAASSSAWASL
jgi:hypothetical protein